jgi:hypothetical protein
VTAPARNDDPTITERGDVRMSVRAPKAGSVTPIRPDLAHDSRARTRYHGPQEEIKTNKPSKVRDFASQHVGEARESLAASWLATDRPRSLTDVARDLTTGSIGNRAAGLGRLAVYTIAYLLCFAVDTNKRAAVTFILIILSLTAAWAISVLAG